MDINDIIDSIYKLPDASKEALLSDAPEVAYPKRLPSVPGKS